MQQDQSRTLITAKTTATNKSDLDPTATEETTTMTHRINLKQAAASAFVLVMIAFAGVAQAAFTGTVEVDPATPAYLPVSLAEWNSDGNFEGWDTSSTRTENVQVSGGFFSGNHLSGSTSDVYIFNNSIAGAPSLDTNSILEIRVRQRDTNPTAGGLQDVTMYVRFESDSGTTYGTDSFTFDTSLVPEDEQFHTYRVDMSAESAWTGGLTGFRLSPINAGTNDGDGFDVDYIRLAQPIPEPATAAMFGLASLLLVRRNRRK